eukprot:COSAG01_NODE_1934_length_8866_cov_17.762633_6_plen_256_part_00
MPQPCLVLPLRLSHMSSRVLLIWAAAAGIWVTAVTIEEHTHRGLHLMKSQRWDDSIGEFRAVLEMEGSARGSDAWMAATDGMNALCHALRAVGFTPPQDIDRFYKWDEPPKVRQRGLFISAQGFCCCCRCCTYCNHCPMRVAGQKRLSALTHHAHEQPPPPPPPPPDIHEAFQGLRGTTWHWNNWRDVTFGCDGSFKAPTDDCRAMAASCYWWADADHLYIEWGNAGRHTAAKPSGGEADASGWRALRGAITGYH